MYRETCHCKSLRGRQKMTLALALTIVLATLFSGCASDEKEVNAPVNLNTVTVNSLRVEDKTASIGQGSGEKIQYIAISGLLDKAVEGKINRRLEALCHMYDDGKLPPYRGVKARTEDMKLAERSVMMSVTYNVNNVLSVQAYFLWIFQNTASEGEKDQGPIYVDCVEACTFDLNTGGELRLNDLFCDNVDAKTEIDGFIAGILNNTRTNGAGEENGFFAQAAPFKGIREDQKFYIWDEGMIDLILDYATPEFKTSFTPMTLNMPFSDKIAVTERYYNAEKSIFADQGEPAKRFLSQFDRGARDVIWTEEVKNGVHISKQIQGYESDPEVVKALIREYTSEDEKMLEAMRKAAGDAEAEGYKEVQAVLNISGYTSRAGEYIFAHVGYSAEVYGQKKEQIDILFTKNQEAANCYRMDGSGPLTLQDLFADSADAKQILKDCIEKHYLEAMEEGGFRYEIDVERYVEGVMEKISGFRLEHDGIQLNYGDTFPVFINSLVKEEDRREYTEYGADQILWNGASFVTYEEIGYSNLVIFE